MISEMQSYLPVEIFLLKANAICVHLQPVLLEIKKTVTNLEKHICLMMSLSVNTGTEKCFFLAAKFLSKLRKRLEIWRNKNENYNCFLCT